MTDKPWYVEITRDAEDPDDRSKIGEPMESIVIGPFDTEEVAVEYMDSPDVDDWVTGEAKAKRYIVDDCVVTQTPTIPSYGVNDPMLMYVEGTPEFEAARGEDTEFLTEPGQPAVGLRLLAHYPMMGDEDGVLWAESMFAHAKEVGLITGYKVFTSLPSVHGIQHILFTVDIDFTGPVTFDMDYHQGEAAASAWLNGVLIQDTDVDLLALSPLHPADITQEV